MLHSFNHILGYAIHASDGDIGSLHDLYFDDQSTAIRYLVVDTGRLAAGPSVLLAPAAIGGVDTAREEIVTGLDAPAGRGQPRDVLRTGRSRASMELRSTPTMAGTRTGRCRR